MGRAEREGKRLREQAQGSRGSEGCRPLQPFRQLVIPPEVEREMQERARRGIRSEAPGWLRGTGRWRSGNAG